jgi:hypothetical protein
MPGGTASQLPLQRKLCLVVFASHAMYAPDTLLTIFRGKIFATFPPKASRG